MVLRVEDLDIYQMAEINHILEILPKKLNAYIKAIKKARDAK